MTNTKKLFAGIFSLILARDASAAVYYYTYTDRSSPNKHTICDSVKEDLDYDHQKNCKAGGRDKCSQVYKGPTTYGCESMDGVPIEEYRKMQKRAFAEDTKNTTEAISHPWTTLGQAGVGAVTYAYNLPGQIAGLPPPKKTSLLIDKTESVYIN